MVEPAAGAERGRRAVPRVDPIAVRAGNRDARSGARRRVGRSTGGWRCDASDDGDIDMLRVLRILKKNNFAGVLIPDHTPQMSCSAPWHAGMAFAMGYLRACFQVVTGEKGLSH